MIGKCKAMVCEILREGISLRYRNLQSATENNVIRKGRGDHALDEEHVCVATGRSARMTCVWFKVKRERRLPAAWKSEYHQRLNETTSLIDSFYRLNVTANFFALSKMKVRVSPRVT